VDHFREGLATVSAGFDVLDIATGENLKPKRVSCTRKDLRQFTDHNPPQGLITDIIRASTGNEEPSKAPPLDGQRMHDSCLDEVVFNFMKAISPWQEIVDAPFVKDSDVPQLELGINYAQQGQWQEALAKFEEALAKSQSQSDIDQDTLAKVYWDLGLAYEYTSQFDGAENAIKKAFEISKEEDYLAELKNIQRLREEHQRLLEQTGEQTPPASP
jgi:tetratricopeptide (TPR) repeat protein